MSKNWVALPDVTEATGGEIMVGYTGMPAGFDLERLEVNVGALRRGVIGWGGFESMTLGAYQGDEDRYDVGVGSAGADGTALGAASVTASKAESSSTNRASNEYLNYLDIRNGSLGIQWNISALNSRISLDQQFNPAIRAQQINRIVQKDAAKGVFQHNIPDVLRDNPLFFNILDVGLDAHFLYLVGDSLVNQQYGETVSSIAIRGIVMAMVRTLRTFTGRAGISDVITDPLFFSARPTRTTLGVGTLATQRLVRGK